MKRLLFIVVIFLPSMAFAQTPNWSTDVAPILYNHCTACHHDGGIAPFSLLTYEGAVFNSPTIKNDIQIRKMPPWPPDPSYSHLAHERVLSASEINTIVSWINGGTPEGDTTLAPPQPVYSTHGMITGTPDLIVKIPPYTSTATTTDVYQCFVIPSGLLAGRYITSFEAVPGNPACVHHVLVYSDTTGVCAALQAASTTHPGYPSFGGVGNNNVTLLGGWVPGSTPMSYPAGFGVWLAPNSDIVIQVHYPAGTAGMMDSTEIHFFFSPVGAPVRNVSIEPLLLYLIPGIIDSPLYIKANTTRSFQEEIPSLFDMTLLGVAPHMHLLGQNIKSYGILPSGDTDHYVSIDKWDFHWQGFYMLPQLKKIPAGTRIRAEAFYDNTTANPNNPNSPPRDVYAGENTTDEMMIVFFVYTPYQPGDENIVVDSAVLLGTPQKFNNYYHGQQLLGVCPNPAVKDIVIKCFLDAQDVGSIILTDMQGRVVRQFMNNSKMNSGYTTYTYPVDGLVSGTYILTLKTSQRILTQKIVVESQ